MKVCRPFIGRHCLSEVSMNPRILLSLPLAAIALSLVPLAAAQAPLVGDAVRGKSLFDDRCIKCHKGSTMGPPYTGLFGKRAGTVKGFEYSDALQKAGVDWGPETLEKWLANPDAFVPGNLMGLRVRNPQDRADLIAYLKTRN
jgi:cytochrome c